jgi:aminopeptidase N
MNLLVWFLLGLVQGGDAVADLRLRAQRALAENDGAQVRALFARPEQAAYLLAMAGRRGGLKNLAVTVVPAPPGWGDWGSHWAIFHCRQDIEEDHDAVYGANLKEGRLELGAEVPEHETGGASIQHQDIRATLVTEQSRVEVHTSLTLTAAEPRPSTVLRLGDPFTLTAATLDGEPARIRDSSTVWSGVRDGDTVRAGGLLICWNRVPKRATFTYGGRVLSPNEDKITSEVAYITSHWVPTIARRPFTTRTTVIAPSDWVARSEGTFPDAPSPGPGPGQKSWTFQCKLPISYPKIVAGRYRLAAEKTVGGKTYRAWHLGEVDTARGERDVNRIASAMEFFEKHFTPFPFPSYEVFDADTYYGIESYSYTLLQRPITTRFVSHELGHTWFGGVLNSPYVEDCWNEGVTQYVDSVLFSKNTDGTLQLGLRSVDMAVPLSAMSVPHAFNGNAYWRGAYVMRMLEREVGLPAVIEGLNIGLRERVGQPTRWKDLLPCFERAAGRKLDWFWKQWVDGAQFPTIRLVSASRSPSNGKHLTSIVVQQTGTAEPFRLRFQVRFKGQGEAAVALPAEIADAEATLRFTTDFAPNEASLDVFELALARVGSAIPVTGERPMGR